MRNPPQFLPYGLALLALACTGEPTSTPVVTDADLPPGGRLAPARDLVVMSRNIYVGADVDAVIGALTTPDPSDDIPALMTAIATLEETEFTVRAAGFAREVA